MALQWDNFEDLKVQEYMDHGKGAGLSHMLLGRSS